MRPEFEKLQQMAHRPGIEGPNSKLCAYLQNWVAGHFDIMNKLCHL